MAEFRMPSLGADMVSGTLVEWLVKPGDHVKRGDSVAVVETQKGAIQVEVFDTGVIDRLVVPEGTEVPVGEVLVTLTVEGEELAPAAAAPQVPPPTRPSPAKPSPAVAVPEAPRVAAPSARPRISPAARRLAEELGVDLARIIGSGPGGAIGLSDIRRAARLGRAAEKPPAPDRQAAMRAAIATVMARSKREIPHYYLGLDIDLKRALAWVEAENLKRPVTERLLPAALLLKAVALAVHEVPEMNGFWTDGAFRPSASVHLGVAISLPHGGLVAPAIHDADKLSLSDLMVALRDLVMRARGGQLRGSEVTDATITVSNLGEQGVDTVFGVIYPPQVALVGFGRISERPWAIDSAIGVRPAVTATLAADHRASVGHRGGLFLAAIDRLLQEPEKL